MPLLRPLSDTADCRGGFVAIGNFDGVHRGHQTMVARLHTAAAAAHRPAVVVTFEPPPVEVLRPTQAPPRLTTLEQKTAYLRAAGADCVLALSTDRGLLNLTADEFFQTLLRDELHAAGMVEGPNFRFGRDRGGDVARLRQLCDAAGMAFTVIESVEIDGQMISSSLIREQVAAGGLRRAAALLGRFHAAVGTVGHGAGRGRELGFPTANLMSVSTLLPPDGVYAGRTTVNGRSVAAAVHLGPNSTFGETQRSFEMHLLDFTGDLYGQQMTVELIEQVRPTVRFDTAAALVAQLHADCNMVRALLLGNSAG